MEVSFMSIDMYHSSGEMAGSTFIVFSIQNDKTIRNLFSLLKSRTREHICLQMKTKLK